MKNTPTKSNKRKRNHKTWLVRVDAKEFDLIQMNADYTGLHPSSLMRELACGYEPKSIIDSKAILELIRLKADIGRLGGLFKHALNQQNGQYAKDTLRLMKQIEKLKNEIAAVVQKLDAKI